RPFGRGRSAMDRAPWRGGRAPVRDTRRLLVGPAAGGGGGRGGGGGGAARPALAIDRRRRPRRSPAPNAWRLECPRRPAGRRLRPDVLGSPPVVGGRERLPGRGSVSRGPRDASAGPKRLLRHRAPAMEGERPYRLARGSGGGRGCVGDGLGGRADDRRPSAP